MVRTLLYVIAGVFLGVAIHLVMILTLPAVAENTIATSIASVGKLNANVVLDDISPGAANPLRLDPNLLYAVCRLDLTDMPGEVSGTLPGAFWSVAVFDSGGTIVYSTTNRDSTGQQLDLGLFDAAQTRLLAQQKIDVPAGIIVQTVHTESVSVVVRLAPPQPAMRDRYRQALSQLTCGKIRNGS
jgi:uncharacterized membrane protein